MKVPEKGASGRDVPKSHRSLTLPEGVHVLPVLVQIVAL